MKLLSALLFLLVIAFGRSLHAQSLDLTNGLGKFTWGMPFPDAVKIADATYGPANVNISTQRPDNKPLALSSRMKPAPSPGQVPPTIHATPPPKVEPLQTLRDKVSSIYAVHEGLILYLQFFNGHLFRISRSINLPLNGYVTKEDLDNARLEERTKSLIHVADGTVLQTFFDKEDDDIFEGIHIYGTGHLSFTATNYNVLNGEFAKLRTQNSDLGTLFLTPLMALDPEVPPEPSPPPATAQASPPQATPSPLPTPAPRKPLR